MQGYFHLGEHDLTIVCPSVINLQLKITFCKMLSADKHSGKKISLKGKGKKRIFAYTIIEFDYFKLLTD